MKSDPIRLHGLISAIFNGVVGAFIALCIFSCAGRVLLPDLFDSFPPPPPESRPYRQAVSCAFFGMAVLVGFLIGLRTFRRWAPAPHATTAPLCLACGYNLTGNASGMCPECGTQVTDDRTE